jgi:hypothetical protein
MAEDELSFGRFRLSLAGRELLNRVSLIVPSAVRPAKRRVKK